MATATATIGTKTLKIIDLLNEPNDNKEKKKNGMPRISLEFFPPKTEEGVTNLKARMERMQDLEPLFCDMTWGAGGSTSERSMELSQYLCDHTSHLANLHLTCTNLVGKGSDPKTEIRSILQMAKAHGIANIVALRGDPPVGVSEENLQTSAEFACALDLVKFIRSEFDRDDFGVSVAGYPEGHPNAIDLVPDPSTMTESERSRSSTNAQGQTFTCSDTKYQAELDYLKQKVDAGADFIITQMFLDIGVYEQFVSNCRSMGITVPILPGILCFTSVAGFVKMTGFCKSRVPDHLWQNVQAATPDTIKDVSIDFCTDLCTKLLQGSEPPPALHFYTLNLEKVVLGTVEKLQQQYKQS